MSNPLIVHTTDATFSQDVLKSDEPVLLDFWAEWCGPCKMIAPILDEVATRVQRQARASPSSTSIEPADAAEIRHPRHPHADPVQERQGGGAEGRRGVASPRPRSLPGQRPVRGYLGNQGRNRPNKGPRQAVAAAAAVASSAIATATATELSAGNNGGGAARRDLAAGAVRGRRRRRDHQPGRSRGHHAAR